MNNYLERFHTLHGGPKLLCLPNAWDAGSAKLFESVGAPAIATSSAGVAWALGYPDGRVMPAAVGVGAAQNMARVLTVPLSFDVEHGYSDDPSTVADNVMRLIDAGVAGINIEDGQDAPSVLAGKIEAIKNAAAKTGTNIFINARTDAYLAALVAEGERAAEAVARARLYAAAGADGIFVPGISKDDEIRTVAAAIALPLNVMAWPGLASAEQLAQLGARRLSAGSGIAQSVWGMARGLARDFVATGDSGPLMTQAMAYGELQGLFKS